LAIVTDRHTAPLNPVIWVAIAIVAAMLIWPAASHSAFLYVLLFAAVLHAVFDVARKR
jgi:hypothetical protein